MLTKDQWNTFVSSTPSGSFLQSWEWGEMQEKLGGSSWRLVLPSNEGVGGVALVIKRPLPLGKSWMYIPRGPVFSETSESRAGLGGQLVSLAQREGAVFIRAEPTEVFGEGWRKAVNDVQPRHTLILDLTKPEDELLAEMRPKTRYNIRLAGKKEVRVRFSTDAADLDHFIKLSSDVHERSAFRYHPEQYYRAMHAALQPASMFEIALAEHGGEVLAAHLLIYFGDTATYVHGASASVKRDLMAPHVLQWESIRRAKEKGFTKYDFFGVAPKSPAESGTSGQAPHPWDGITKFKEGFGGYRVEYIGAYDYVLDPVWYWTYGTSKKLNGLLR